MRYVKLRDGWHNLMFNSVMILRSNPVAPDPRVEKEARALHQAGYNVVVVAWDRTASLPRIEERCYARIERVALTARFGLGLKNLIPLLRWQVGLLVSLWKHRRDYEIIHACDFDTVLPALVMKWLYAKKVVYDVFDFYADMIQGVPAFIRDIIRSVDLWVMRKVDALILVDEVRMQQIGSGCPERLELIYNSPETCPLPAPVPMGTPLRIAYVGLLQVDRGLLVMLNVLRRHPEWELDLAGFGRDDALIRGAAEGLANVRISGRIPYAEALELYARSDVMFATYNPSVPNHRYSSANKLFEAMMLGKPIIVARGTSMDRIVEGHQVGFVVDYGDVDQLERALEEIASWDCDRRRKFSTHARSVYMEHFAWGKMATRLINLYRRVSSVPTRSGRRG